MDTKHTKGPWTISLEYDGDFLIAGERNVCEVFNANHFLNVTTSSVKEEQELDAEAKANASLIAKAYLIPEVVDVLKQLLPSECQFKHFASPNYNNGQACEKCGYCKASGLLAKLEQD